MSVLGAFLLTAVVAAFVLFMYSEAKRMKEETNERINYMKTQRECLISIETSIRKISTNLEKAINEIEEVSPISLDSF